ncbi:MULTISPECIES: LysR family transcriptional regulator [Paraburkholderia]|uniref:LysR family transcriptional regulator n=1 Tax=Paraburkholderia TaxID=1822464 RepID=UPI002AB7C76C|nr:MULTISPECIES: LysR family transcriptional regulator [Paraburkholderia]
MNYSGIEAFLAIVRCNGVGRAAEMLCLTQPTVSKRLRLLEEELGVTLIERGRGVRDVKLTEAGEAFLDVAERWVVLYRETIAISGQSERSSLRIGSVAGINYELLDDVYARLAATEPPPRISIQSGKSRELFEKVTRRELDVAFTRQAFAHEQVVTRKLYSDPMVGVCLPSSRLAGQGLVETSELQPEHEIFAHSDEEFQSWHDARWGTRVQGRITVDTIHLTLSLLRRSDQWSLVPAKVAQVACQRHRFASFTLRDPTPERSCFLVTPASVRRGAVKALDALEEIIRVALSVSA